MQHRNKPYFTVQVTNTECQALNIHTSIMKPGQVKTCIEKMEYHSISLLWLFIKKMVRPQ